MELTNSKEEIEQLQTEIFHLNKKLAHLRLVTPEDHHELIDRRPTGKARVMLNVFRNQQSFHNCYSQQ